MKLFYAIFFAVMSLNAYAQDVKVGEWVAEVNQENPASSVYSLKYYLLKCDEGTANSGKYVAIQRFYDDTLKAQIFNSFERRSGRVSWHLREYDYRGVYTSWFELAQRSETEFKGLKWYVGDRYEGKVSFTFIASDVPGDVNETASEVCSSH